MDRDEWTRTAYRKVVDVLDEALSSLDRLPAGDAAPREWPLSVVDYDQAHGEYMLHAGVVVVAA